MRPKSCGNLYVLYKIRKTNEKKKNKQNNSKISQCFGSTAVARLPLFTGQQQQQALCNGSVCLVSSASLSLASFTRTTHNTHTQTPNRFLFVVCGAIKRKEKRQSNVNAISQCPCHYNKQQQKRTKRTTAQRARSTLTRTLMSASLSLSGGNFTTAAIAAAIYQQIAPRQTVKVK